MYGYLFVHITLHGFFSEFSVVRGGGNDETVSTGCGSPSVLHPWMLLLHMQETALWIPPVCCVLDDICKRQLCGFPQWDLLSSRGGGPDTLAPVLHTHVFYFYFLDISLSIDIFFKDGVSKFLTQVHMRPKAHPVCLKAQRFVVILSAHK